MLLVALLWRTSCPNSTFAANSMLLGCPMLQTCPMLALHLLLQHYSSFSSSVAQQHQQKLHLQEPLIEPALLHVWLSVCNHLGHEHAFSLAVCQTQSCWLHKIASEPECYSVHVHVPTECGNQTNQSNQSNQINQIIEAITSINQCCVCVCVCGMFLMNVLCACACACTHHAFVH